MSNPIQSHDLYQPGPQDTLDALKKDLAAIQAAIVSITKEAKDLRAAMKSLNAANSPAKVVAAATEADRIASAKRLLLVNEAAKVQQIHNRTLKQAAVHEQQVSAATSRANIARQREIDYANRAATANKKHSGSLTGLIGSIRNLAYAYFSLGAAAQVFQNILKQTKALDTLTVAFRTTLGSTQAAAQAQEYLLDVSERFGANLLGASQAYLKFSAASTQAGVSAEQTQKIFTSVTKASSILGLGAERTSYVFLALEQIMSKGRLSTEELRRQLGEHLPGAFGIAAEAMGVTTAKLTDMLKKGEIASTDFLPKFAVQLEKAYGIDQVERIDNLAAAQERFNNELTLLVKDLDLSSAFKDFFNTLANGVRFVRENADAFLKLGQAILYVATAWAAWKIGAAITSIGSLRKAMVALNAAFAANPVGAIAVAILAVVGVVDLLTDKVNGATVAKKALNEALEDGTSSTKLLKVQVNELVKAYRDETTSAKEKEKILRTLNDLGITAVDLDGDKVISTNEVTEAVKKQIKALELLAQTQRLEQEFTSIDNRQSDLKKRNPFDDGGQSIASAIDGFFGTNITVIGTNRTIAELDIAKKKITDKLTELYEAAFTADVTDPTKTPTPDPPDPTKDKFDAEKERLALIFDDQERELAILKHGYEEKRKDFIAHNEDTTKLDQKYRDDRIEILNKYIDIQDDAELDAAERQKKRFKEATDDVKDYFAKRRQAIEDAENKRKNNVDTLRDEFNARRKHEEEIFDLTKHSEEEIADFKLKLKIDELNDEIQLHRVFGKVLSDEELARAIELRDKMQAAMDAPNTANKNEEIDIFSLLGIDFGGDSEKLDAFKQTIEFVGGELQNFLDFQKEIVDQQIENADRLVDNAENNLNRQIALAAANQANNVAGAQAELALAKKTQEDALKQRKKVQKQELALDTLSQTSNLITAVSAALKLGPILGPIAVGAILATFALSKIKAIQLINKKTFRKGGFEEIGGGSHESGKDTNVGGNNYAERGESVGIFTAKATRRYKPSLKALVNAANKGVLENILIQDRRAIQGINMINKTDIDTSLMEKRLTRLVSLNEAKTFVDGRGRLVRVDRGRTTIVNR